MKIHKLQHNVTSDYRHFKKMLLVVFLSFVSYVYLLKTPPNKTHFNVSPEIVL